MKQILKKATITLALCGSLAPLSLATTMDDIHTATDYQGYPVSTLDRSIISEQLGDEFDGNLSALFALNEELLYAVVEVVGGQESHILYQGLEQGEPYFGILHSQSGNMEATTLWAQIARFQNSSNMAIDYSPMADFTTEEEFTDYLQEILSTVAGLSINQHARRDIAQFVQVILQQMGTVEAQAKENLLVVEGESLQIPLERLETMETSLLSVLEKADATPNSQIQKTLQVVVHQMDKTQSMQVTIDRTVLDVLKPDMNLKIQMGESQFSLEFSREALVEQLEGQDYFTILLANLSEEKYAVHFFTAAAEKTNKLATPVTVTLPATSAYDRVRIIYMGGQDNWGGQWDPVNQSIRFSTSYTGEYEIKDGSETILDLAETTAAQQEAIPFMVSKGFFGLENGNFRPDQALSRYGFSIALVGMFYALDRDLTTTFTDVPSDSFYYDYVASIQEKNLVSGYDGNNFGGNENITQEQVLAIIARTLVEDKAYLYPENPQDFLSFSGANQVSSWAEEATALCFREGIILRGEHVNPQEEISRAQAATYLYRLFNLLYEVSPVSTHMSETLVADSYDTKEIAMATAAVFGAWTLVFSILVFIKNSMKKISWNKKQKKKAKQLANSAQGGQ